MVSHGSWFKVADMPAPVYVPLFCSLKNLNLFGACCSWTWCCAWACPPSASCLQTPASGPATSAALLPSRSVHHTCHAFGCLPVIEQFSQKHCWLLLQPPYLANVEIVLWYVGLHMPGLVHLTVWWDSVVFPTILGHNVHSAAVDLSGVDIIMGRQTYDVCHVLHRRMYLMATCMCR